MPDTENNPINADSFGSAPWTTPNRLDLGHCAANNIIDSNATRAASALRPQVSTPDALSHMVHNQDSDLGLKLSSISGRRRPESVRGSLMAPHL